MKSAIVYTLVLGTVANGVNALGEFERGRQEGMVEARYLWSGDCSNTMDLERICKIELIEGKYASKQGDSWRARQFKSGARAGVKETIESVTEHCGHDTSECHQVGTKETEMMIRSTIHTHFFQLKLASFRWEWQQQNKLSIFSAIWIVT